MRKPALSRLARYARSCSSPLRRRISPRGSSKIGRFCSPRATESSSFVRWRQARKPERSVGDSHRRGGVCFVGRGVFFSEGGGRGGVGRAGRRSHARVGGPP